MYEIVFHQTDGSSQAVQLERPLPIMQAAIRNGIPGIVGECGGQAMCATCHVYVREEYLRSLPEKSEDEKEMLEATAAEFDERRSRLGCQIVVGEDLERIEVDVPETQL
ncbi:2Fe-2S iron-sulfur cluster-binding protein [Aquisalimonas lutea]|uniref:2Fe-2S iron-sulfur cluster-binding protein n=1 Tax=Aquisalimonas lutea TaxID=1327750 RepID=UPI0025B4B864|nr:2Fe-2S iron-sulfur cluster-binding protein [Aquisalimonas lutea]MDN3518107.1 2Fe-2S iron-sulfur cluster-binding protein [Aquisalimonas lutea]